MERTESSFCRPFPGIAFEGSKMDRLENGSLMYDKLVYPAGSYRAFENKTYGCICNLRTCLRKCCKRNEILGEGDRPNCVRLSNGSFAPDLVLKQRELATEIKGTSGLSKLFVVVEDMQCQVCSMELLSRLERIFRKGGRPGLLVRFVRGK